MSKESRLLAGWLLVILPSVMVGGVSILTLLITPASKYMENPLRQDLWRAGHAHAGVFLVLALLVLRYVDEARLSPAWKWFARVAAPTAAILVPGAFFLSVLSPEAAEPNALIYLAYVGAALLAAGMVTLGVGLIRATRTTSGT
jgi:uncharacterized membrane protein